MAVPIPKPSSQSGLWVCAPVCLGLIRELNPRSAMWLLELQSSTLMPAGALCALMNVNYSAGFSSFFSPFSFKDFVIRYMVLLEETEVK